MSKKQLDEIYSIAASEDIPSNHDLLDLLEKSQVSIDITSNFFINLDGSISSNEMFGKSPLDYYLKNGFVYIDQECNEIKNIPVTEVW